MKKITFFLVLLNIFSAIEAKNLWEKYLGRMQQFEAPKIDEEVFLDILRKKYASFGEEKSESSWWENSRDASETSEGGIQSPTLSLSELIRKGLEDGEGVLRKSSLIYLVNHQMKEFSRFLVDKIAQEQDVTEKKWLIWAFGEIGSSEDVLALVQYLRNEQNPYIMNLLAAAISKIAEKDGSITPLLMLAQNSRNLYVRSTSIIGLGKIGDSRAFGPLWDMALNHKTKEIRFCAVIALSTVMKGQEELDQKLNILKNRFRIAPSLYEKLALAYTIQKVGGYDEGLYMYMVRFLDKSILNEVAMDLLEDLPFRQGKERLEIMAMGNLNGMMKQRIESLINRLRGGRN